MRSAHWVQAHWGLAFVLVSTSPTFAELSCERDALGECTPGRVLNPAGLQKFAALAYNPHGDEYVIGYTGIVGSDPLASPLVASLTPDGEILGEVPLARNTGATHLAIVYNPDRQEYLVAWRQGDPVSLHARYLRSDLTPIGASFRVPTAGVPSLAYSPDSELYMLTGTLDFGGGIGQLWYHMIRGDSTAPGVVGSEMVAAGPVHSDAVSYGAAPKKFFVVYVVDLGGSRKATIMAAFVGPDGSLERIIPLDLSDGDQLQPYVTYSARFKSWVVGYEDWENAESRSSDFKGVLINDSGMHTTTPFFFCVDVGAGVFGPHHL